MPYSGGRVWVDVPEGTTAPPGAPDLDAEGLNSIEADIAAAFDYKPGDVVEARKDRGTGFWPSGWLADRTPVYSGGAADAGVRPTDRADVTVIWVGPDPSPPTVASGTGGMLDWDRRDLTAT